MADPITEQQMETLLRNQAQTFANLLKGSNYAGAAPTPSAPASGGGGGAGMSVISDAVTSGVKILGTAAGEAAGAVGQLATGSYTARDALTSFSNVVAAAAPGFGGVLKNMGGAVLDANDRMRESAKVGVDFAGDLGKANKAVVDSGASQQQFADEMRRNASQYSGAGVTMNKAIENVLGFSRDLQETPAIEQMKKAGTTQQEVAELAMISMKERRGLDLNDKEARQQMLENTINLSGEMNEVARLTGVSRQEQMAKLAKDKENVMVQAELMGMDKDATNRYDMLKTKLGPLGDSVSKLADEIFTGGVRTKEGSDRMAALGPAGAAFERAVLAQKNATTQAQKDAAAAAMEKAKSDIAAYQKSEQYLSQVKQDRSSVGDEARKMMSENKELKGRQTAEATAAGAAAAEGKPAPTSAEIQRARVDQVKQDTARVGPDGKPTAGSAVSSGINQIDQRLFQESKQAADLFKELNTQVGKYVNNDKGIQEQLNPRVKVNGEMVSRSNTKDGTALGAIREEVTEQLKIEPPEGGTAATGGRATGRRAQQRATPAEAEPTPAEPTPARPTGRRPAQARAEGGPVEPGTPYWVGEDGPELVKFDTKSTVVPTDKIPTAGQSPADVMPKMPDLGSMIKDMIPDFSSLKGMMPDMSKMFGDMIPDTDMLKQSMPDMSKMFGDMIPDPDILKQSMPDMSKMFGDMLPNIDMLKQSMPDIDSLFKDMAPDTEAITKALPDFDSMMGDMSASISDSSTLAVENVKLDALSKVDAAKKETTEATAVSEAPKPAAPEAPTESATAPIADGATLSDLKEQLIQLNTAVTQLIAHSAQTAENSGATVKATKDLSGNLYT